MALNVRTHDWDKLNCNLTHQGEKRGTWEGKNSKGKLGIRDRRHQTKLEKKKATRPQDKRTVHGQKGRKGETLLGGRISDKYLIKINKRTGKIKNQVTTVEKNQPAHTNTAKKRTRKDGGFSDHRQRRDHG